MAGGGVRHQERAFLRPFLHGPVRLETIVRTVIAGLAHARGLRGSVASDQQPITAQHFLGGKGNPAKRESRGESPRPPFLLPVSFDVVIDCVLVTSFRRALASSKVHLLRPMSVLRLFPVCLALHTNSCDSPPNLSIWPAVGPVIRCLECQFAV
uniref:Uncharacterized protein n=1 Tax=Setaria viridis TaxID=4556 RepID=A0A4V6DD39_SETVI|nr:hypothetical protein SEVIR_1G207400v2 [Setaria viridis]